MVNDENVAGKGHCRKSPALMEKPSVMHRKYMPTTASATLIHSFRRMRCPVKIRRKGTMMIYSAVINPAFPTVVYCMPYCCRLLARNSTQPQHTPPISSGRFGICRFFSRSASGVRWSIRKMQGISTNPPRTLLAKRKAKGPT